MGFGMDLALTFEDSAPFKLTVDHYRALDRGGAFDEAPRVELIEGMIVCMSPMSPAHGRVTAELVTRFSTRLKEIGSKLVPFAGSTVATPPHSAPDPDITIAPLPIGEDWLVAAAAKLVIEVSRTTLGKDLKVKRDIYAAAGVPEYWVVDVNRSEVHRFADPRDGAYRAEPPIPLAGTLRSLTLPDLVIDGSGIL